MKNDSEKTGQVHEKDARGFEALRRVCEERGKSLLMVDKMKEDYITLYHELNLVIAERTAPCWVIDKFINDVLVQ